MASRRRSGTIFILLALIIIVVIALAAFLLRDQIFPAVGPAAQATPPPQTSMMDIVVMAQPVSHGTLISEEVLTKVSIPQSANVDGLYFTEYIQVVNKVARQDLSEGMILTPSLLLDASEGTYAATRVDPGMVAIAIPITRLTSNAYSLLPGDHVNIIAAMMLVDIDPAFQTKLPNLTAAIIGPGPAGEGETAGTAQNVTIQPSAGGLVGRAELDPSLNEPLYVIPSEDQRPRLISQTLVQDAVVLWVGEFPDSGQITEGPQPTPIPNEDGTVNALPKPDIISLIVTPQDAVTLNYLMLSGAELNLVLRGVDDDGRIATEPVTLQYIMQQYNIPNPAKLPYGMEPSLQDLAYPDEQPVAIPAE